MKEEESMLLRQLILNRRFPLSYDKCSEEERRILLQIYRNYSKKDIKKEMHKYYIESDC